MNSKKSIVDDRLQLDVSTNKLLFLQNRNKERVKLDPITVKVIIILLNNQNHVVNRTELIDEVWDGNKGVGEGVLTRNIYKIRKVLEQHDMEKLIETIPK